jgi:D-3-phosphoglycerate dehydrogenase
VVDEAALRELMATRGLRAGLDVFQNEPAKDGAFDSAILDEAGLYGTHHIGASTDQASDAVADEVVRIIEGYVQSGNVLNVVNLESAPPATHLLVVRHADRVGVLASVLGTLREAGVSVQEMENIIFKGAAAASARIQLDRAPAPEHLEQIRAHADIFSATLVALESAR